MALPSVSELLIAQPLLAYPVVFAGGVLTSLTPCIYPMIPITVAVVGGQGEAGANADGTTRRRGRTWALTAAYVLGMAMAFA
ncbi:MAG: hypothetical protein IBJ19_09430, partial [Gemmatimonadaceae bacterium]|nr:hypothetical protein [Gemmatimonadaceae bacterium]